MKKNREVIVGMSGGVDSAVSAWLLKKQGYHVTGVILRIWEDDPHDTEKGWGERTCCHVPMVEYLCNKIIDIPYAVVNAQSDFNKDVVSTFKSSYLSGETPNPCTSCNQKVKLPLLRKWAEENRITKVATGHYTSWQYSKEYRTHGLAMAQDVAKDQSYFLSRTRGIDPDNTLFPVGALTKAQVKEIAKSAGFPVEGLLENQEVCFVSEKRVTDFLKVELAENNSGQWSVHLLSGERLGTIPTAIGLTRGQRRGLTVAGGKRLYVHSIDIPRKTVCLSEKKDLFEDTFSVREPMGILFDTDLHENATIFVRFRSTMAPVPCKKMGEGNRFSLTEPHDGVVEGQIAAFYDQENILIGSGILTRKGDRPDTQRS